MLTDGFPHLPTISKENSTRESKFVKVGAIVIFKLERYIMLRGNLIKDNRKIKCSSDPFKIPVSSENIVSVSPSFFLQAPTNHSVSRSLRNI